jgi:hypothetical protein
MMIRSLCFCGVGETVARSYPSPLWGGSARSAGVGVAHGSARIIPLLKQPVSDRPADGGQHGMLESARSDEVRDAFLQSQGFQVLRFWNSDIDANLEGVMESILGTLKHVPSR